MHFGTFHLIGSPSMAPPKQRFDETVSHINLADALGFDAVWVAEHHFSNYGYSANPLLLIAHVAPTARRVRFGQAVLVSPFWHPLRLAEDIATTDLLTDGRLDIGLGRGYQPLEFKGFDTPQDASRSIFEEHFALMKTAWTQEDFTFSGKHYTVPTRITVLPRPLQQPHPPIWLAVQSETSLGWAAENGCNILLTGGGTDWDSLARWIATYRQMAEPEARIGILRHVLVTETEHEAREALWQSRWQRNVATRLRLGQENIRAGRNDLSGFVEDMTADAWWDRVVYGTPERCIDQLRRQADQGVTDFLGWFDIGGVPAEQVQQSMRLFADKVMPALEPTSVR